MTVELHTTESSHREATDGFLTDLKRNPAAFATLSLLAQINFAAGPQHSSQIIAERKGGIYPSRTVEELSLLEDAGLIRAAPIEGGKERLYTISRAGKMEIALNEIQDPAVVAVRLSQALESIERDPPKLPPERYGYEEFRFTWESIYWLLSKIFEKNAYRKVHIAALGSPLVALFVSRCLDIVGSVSVFDINEEIVTAINSLEIPNVQAFVYDARDPFPPTLQDRFDAFVMDPPWHNEWYAMFADRAWQALRPFGRVFTSTFSPETRPEAREELDELFRRFIRGGFHIDEIVQQFFGYQIPAYERLVFDAMQIPVTSRGNYGVLVVLEKGMSRKELCTTQEMSVKLSDESPVLLHGPAGRSITVWIRSEGLSGYPQDGLSIRAHGERTYTTTSRSKRKREGVNVLTEDHQAFSVNHPEILRLVYDYWMQGMGVEEIAALLIRNHGCPAADRAREDATEGISFFEQYLGGRA